MCRFSIVSVSSLLCALGATAQAQQATWYYCEPLHLYYPYAPRCPVPFKAVPAGPKPRNQTSVDRTAEQDAAKARQAEQAAEQQKREADAAAERQRRASAQAAAEAARKAKIEAQRQVDEANGFRIESIADIRLDYPQMPANTQVIVTGYFSQVGQISQMIDKSSTSTPIYIMTDELPREVRKTLLDCQDCYVTVWAHSGCVMTMLNQPTQAPCFIADQLKHGGYGPPDEE